MDSSLLDKMMDAPNGGIGSKARLQAAEKSGGDDFEKHDSPAIRVELSPEAVESSGLDIRRSGQITPHQEDSLLEQIVDTQNRQNTTPTYQEIPSGVQTRVELTPEQEKQRNEYIKLQQEAVWRIFELRSFERFVDIKYGRGFRKNVNIDAVVENLKATVKYENKDLGEAGFETKMNLMGAKELQKARQRVMDNLAEVFTKIENKAKEVEPRTLQIETLEEKANRIKGTFKKALAILNKSGKDVVMWFKKWTAEDYMILRAALEGCDEYINLILSGRDETKTTNKDYDHLIFEIGYEHIKEIEMIQDEIARLKKFINDMDIGNKATSTARQMDRDTKDPFFNQPLDKAMEQLDNPEDTMAPPSMRNIINIHDELASFENLLNFLESEYLAGSGQGFANFKKLMGQLRLKPFKWWHSPIERDY